MKFKHWLLLLVSSASFAAHVTDRSIYMTDVVSANKTSIFKFKNVLPTASRVCTFNSDNEAVSSSVTDTTLTYLDISSSLTGLLSAKQDTLTFGNITTPTSGLHVTSGTNSTVGPNVVVSADNSSATLNGLLTSANWTTFNNKIGSLNGLTSSTQTFATASSQNTFTISSSGTVHTFDLGKAIRAATTGITVDGGGSTITSGLKGFVTLPYGGTINEWVVLCDQSGSIVFDVWKVTYAGFPGSVANSIAGTDLPTVSSAQKNRNQAISAWSTLVVSTDDILEFNVNSATTVTRCNLVLGILKN